VLVEQILRLVSHSPSTLRPEPHRGSTRSSTLCLCRS
jgi:hypothetical protein